MKTHSKKKILGVVAVVLLIVLVVLVVWCMSAGAGPTKEMQTESSGSLGEQEMITAEHESGRGDKPNVGDISAEGIEVPTTVVTDTCGSSAVINDEVVQPGISWIDHGLNNADFEVMMRAVAQVLENQKNDGDEKRYDVVGRYLESDELQLFEPAVYYSVDIYGYLYINLAIEVTDVSSQEEVTQLITAKCYYDTVNLRAEVIDTK